MGTTTRRTSELEQQRMKEIQQFLDDQGIKVNQVQLGEIISEFLISNYSSFFDFVQSKFQYTEKVDDSLNRLLFQNYSSEENTNVVEDHDVVL